MKQLHSYLRDTTDFLNKLQSHSNLDDQDWLVTLDVTSLYTSIPHKGLESLDYFLKTLQNPRLPSQFILDLTKFMLTNNYFLFVKEYYLQTQGTAMGTHLAPSYANLFIGKFELDFIYNNNPFGSFIKYWARYIDDCFLIWKGSEEDLFEFVQFLNSRLGSITFSVENNLSKNHF